MKKTWTYVIRREIYLICLRNYTTLCPDTKKTMFLQQIKKRLNQKIIKKVKKGLNGQMVNRRRRIDKLYSCYDVLKDSLLWKAGLLTRNLKGNNSLTNLPIKENDRIWHYLHKASSKRIVYSSSYNNRPKATTIDYSKIPNLVETQKKKLALQVNITGETLKMKLLSWLKCTILHNLIVEAGSLSDSWMKCVLMKG